MLRGVACQHLCLVGFHCFSSLSWGLILLFLVRSCFWYMVASHSGGRLQFGLAILNRFSAILLADSNLSSTELESGNAIGAFLQAPAPVLDKISGPKGARFLSSTGLRSGNLIERVQFFPAPALDKNRSPRSTSSFRRTKCPELRWAKWRDSYHRIASESCHCDSNR